jgi:hypothetical protein
MQQINLYQAEFKPKVVILNAFQMLLIASAVLLLIIIASFFSSSQYDDQTTQLAVEQQAFNNITQQSNTLKQEILQYGEQPLLKAKLTSLQKQLKQQKAILRHIADDNLNPQSGFSPTLRSLSGQHIDQVWLKNFSLRDGGRSITIQGSSTRSELIPEYIDSLAKSSTFSGKQFSVFQMSSPDNNTETYDFELHTQGGNR